MRVIICDRCKKRMEKPERVGYVALNYRHPKTDDLMDDNAMEDMDFCDECMQEIEQFIRAKPAAEKPKAEPKQKQVDAGKIQALAKAGWSTKQIAEEVGCTAPTVRKYIGESDGRGEH